MKNERIKGSKEEVNMVKRKYKKIKRTILLISAFILVIIVGNRFITTLRLQQILKKNIGINLGTNYKITRIENGMENIIYSKDGIYCQVMNHKNGLFAKDDKIYFVNYETKQYQLLDSSFIELPSSSLVFLNYFWIEESSIHSFKDMLFLVYESKVKFGSEIINDVKYITIEMKAIGEKIWIHPDTNLVEKENMHGQILEQKVEKNVVTDENIKAPWELDFTEIFA